MPSASISSSKTKKKVRTPAQLVASDTLIYLLLVFLVWGTWQLSLLELFTAGDDFGYWIGVVGAVMPVSCCPDGGSPETWNQQAPRTFLISPRTLSVAPPPRPTPIT